MGTAQRVWTDPTLILSDRQPGACFHIQNMGQLSLVSRGWEESPKTASKVTRALLCVPDQVLKLSDPLLFICDMWPISLHTSRGV